VLLLRQ